MNPSEPCNHTTVLLPEAVQALVTHPDGLYVDGTYGRGGHSRAVLALLGQAGRLLAFDKDPQAVAAAADITDPRFAICHASFADMAGELSDRGVHQVDRVGEVARDRRGVSEEADVFALQARESLRVQDVEAGGDGHAAS